MLSSSTFSLLVAFLLLTMPLAAFSWYTSLSYPIMTIPTAQKTINFHTPVLSSGYSLPSHITQNLLLSPQMGIILVHSLVTIEKNASITIQPGTTLAVDEYGGIDVHGRLTVRGTKENPVNFITNEQNETNRHWVGLLLEPGSVSTITYSIFHHASPPISCLPTSIYTLEHITSLFDTTNTTPSLCQDIQNGAK